MSDSIVNPQKMPDGITPKDTGVNKETQNLLRSLGSMVGSLSKSFSKFSTSFKYSIEEEKKINKERAKANKAEVKKSSKTTEDVLDKFSDASEKFQSVAKNSVNKTVVGGLSPQNQGTVLSDIDTSVKKNTEEGAKKSSQFLQKSQEKFSELSESFRSVAETSFKKTIVAGLGPLNTLSGVVEEISGVNILEKLNPFKPSKRNPKPGDVAKKGDAGSLLLFNFFNKDKKKVKKEVGGGGPLAGVLGGLGAGLAGKIGPMLLKGGAIAAIVGSLAWAIADGIKGVNLAEEWGTKKLSAFIGGFLGGTESGWKNAFKNSGKGALMGAGTGFLIAGPVGAIVGGLLGAAVGGVMGYFGGENIAKGLDKVGEAFDVENLQEETFNSSETPEDFVSGLRKMKGLRKRSIKDFTDQQLIDFYTDNPYYAKSRAAKDLEQLKKDVTAVQSQGDPNDFISSLDPESMRNAGISYKDVLTFLENNPSYLRDDSLAGIRDLGNNINRPKRVNDAIIKDNMIIEPSPDDTLIATKNPVSMVSSNNGGLTNQAGSGQVLNLLRELITAVKEQNLNVNIPTNFSEYKNMGVREF